MITAIKSARILCGLSQKKAAEYLGVSINTVKKWDGGVNRPPEDVWVSLADLFGRIQDAADITAKGSSIKGVNPRMWGNIQFDIGNDPLPVGADVVAQAIALMTVINCNKPGNHRRCF